MKTVCMIMICPNRPLSISFLLHFRYNIRSDAWSSCTDLPIKLVYCAAAVVGHTIFVAGGYSPLKYPMANVHCYDTGTERWCPRAHMKIARFLHCLVSHKEMLYAIGGCSARETLKYMIEIYDPSSNEWTPVELTCGRDIPTASAFIKVNNPCSFGQTLFLWKIL